MHGGPCGGRRRYLTCHTPPSRFNPYDQLFKAEPLYLLRVYKRHELASARPQHVQWGAAILELRLEVALDISWTCTRRTCIGAA
jgi:hypothetical protein